MILYKIKFLIFLIMPAIVSWSIEVSASAKNDLISCTMLDGSLTHSISLDSSGKYTVYVSFPPYYQNPSEEVLEQKKKEWANWDGVSAPPTDPRKIAFGVPLTNSNIVSFDLQRLSKKASFFDKIFPPYAKGTEAPSPNFGKLFLKFGREQCNVIEKDSLMSVYCENNESITVNGVSIEGVSLRMSRKNITEVVFSEEDNSGTIEEGNSVSADLTFTSQNNYYRSSFTYSPNGNDKQCSIRGLKLTALAE